jgi:hypothetical protein
VVSKLDEIHNMQLATRTGAEVPDTLKYFSERYLQPTGSTQL